ncbi:MAG: hypothetical protein CMJ78_15245 [Planctomycetaceae bacterium]|nr:hypothetical protein [Planctomycetaceae bacterium]
MGRQSLFQDTAGDGGFGKSRTGDEADLDITPMIDVTFLLLIFFMVTSTMKGTPDLNVPPAEHGTGVPSSKAAVVTIRNNGGEPQILLGDGKGPEGSLADIRPYAEQFFQASDGDFQIVVKADRDVEHGFVQEVMKQVSEIENVKYSLGVQDKKK